MEIPAHWKMTTIGEIATFGRKKPANLKSSKEEVSFLPMPLVEAISGNLALTQKITHEEGQKRSLTYFENGDVIFAKITPCMENGKIALAKNLISNAAYGSTEFHVISPSDRVSGKFLRYFLVTDDFRVDAERSMTGAVGQRRVSKQYLENHKFPLPPIAEQHQIIEILEDHLSRLDAVEATLSKAEMLKKRFYQASVLTRMQDRGNSHLDSQLVSFGEYKYSLPADWSIATLGELADLIEYGTSTKTNDVIDDSTIPVLRMGNIVDGEIDWTSLKYLSSTLSEFPKLLLKEGDLLFNRTNSAELVGKSAIFHGFSRPVTFASYLIRVRFNELVNPEWSNLILNSPYGRQYINSVVTQQVGQANVNGTKLKAFPIPLPPRTMQDSIIREHSEMRESLNQLQKSLIELRAQNKSFRRSLLQAAFSGQLTKEVTNV